MVDQISKINKDFEKYLTNSTKKTWKNSFMTEKQNQIANVDISFQAPKNAMWQSERKQVLPQHSRLLKMRKMDLRNQLEAVEKKQKLQAMFMKDVKVLDSIKKKDLASSFKDAVKL